MSLKTVVIGASPNPNRYSSMAVNRLREKGHEVVAIGLREGKLGDIPIVKGRPDISNVHTVTMYIRPEIQRSMYDYILSLKPSRIIFNPGTENDELEQMAREAGIETVEGCTLVMLSIGIF